jgi:hypothetical protein
MAKGARLMTVRPRAPRPTASSLRGGAGRWYPGRCVWSLEPQSAVPAATIPAGRFLPAALTADGDGLGPTWGPSGSRRPELSWGSLWGDRPFTSSSPW